MLMYMAGDDGVAGDRHLVHYGARILGGVGLVMTEVMAVAPEGRISESDLGLWDDAHVAGLQRITEFAHQHGAVMGAQLAHAGRKATVSDAVAPSPIAYGDFELPRELQIEEIDGIVEAYGAAAKRAVESGFDCVELHAAHGYLLHEFLSPVSNVRTDEYGGGFENRCRLLRRVVAEVRRVIPDDMPCFVRFSATDGVRGGSEVDESLRLAAGLANEGVDLFDVSAGNVAPGYAGEVYPGYQADYARELKHELGVLTGTVGSVASPDLADYLVSSGAADLVFVGRALLRNPNWALDAARGAEVDLDLAIPTYARATGPYARGF